MQKKLTTKTAHFLEMSRHTEIQNTQLKNGLNKISLETQSSSFCKTSPNLYFER